MEGTTESPVALGKTEVRVSPVGVGTNSWGAKGGADPRKLDTFNALLDAGITLFDTAELYTGTASERTIGECLRASGRTPVIVTKFFPFPWRLSGRRLRDALKQSLNRLGIPTMDVYLLHYPLGPISLETWVGALAEEVHAGHARAVGISNCNADQVRRAHAVLKERGLPLACNEIELSLLKRAPLENGLLDVCAELGVSVVAYRPLAQGMLSGKYSAETPPRGMRSLLYGRRRLVAMKPLLESLRSIGGRHGKTPSQVALNWVICKGALPIPGAKDANQARENAGAMGWRLSAEEVRELDQL